jgi:uncharacterized protein DUF6580
MEKALFGPGLSEVFVSFSQIFEDPMVAYFLILLAVISRVAPHPAWFNFTAVGGSLLYFGARRPLRQAILPVAVLAGADYFLTVVAYSYPFELGSYLVTWLWYGAIILLGAKMLKSKASMGSILAASALSATSFFAASNFAVWAGSNMYPHSIAGLTACYAAGLPFYRNDMISTLAVAILAFGAPQVVNRMVRAHGSNQPLAG